MGFDDKIVEKILIEDDKKELIEFVKKLEKVGCRVYTEKGIQIRVSALKSIIRITNKIQKEIFEWEFDR